jgi:hypothetical protein
LRFVAKHTRMEISYWPVNFGPAGSRNSLTRLRWVADSFVPRWSLASGTRCMRKPRRVNTGPGPVFTVLANTFFDRDRIDFHVAAWARRGWPSRTAGGRDGRAGQDLSSAKTASPRTMIPGLAARNHQSARRLKKGPLALSALRKKASTTQRKRVSEFRAPGGPKFTGIAKSFYPKNREPRSARTQSVPAPVITRYRSPSGGMPVGARPSEAEQAESKGGVPHRYQEEPKHQAAAGRD